jgi:DNA-binding HxlR family transcriptional regulator
MRLLDGAGERGRGPRLPTGINGMAAAARVDYSAPFQHALELIGKRWTGALIRALLPGPERFNALLMGIPGSSDRVLTERLRELEAEGLLERLVESERPIKVRYRLTDRGRALAPVFAALDAWASEARPRCSQ